MTINFGALNDWLIKSIPGIIFLGALGSLLAAPIIHAARLAVGNLIASKERFVKRLLYPYAKEIMIAEQLRDNHEPKSKETKYLAYFTFHAVMWVSVAIIFFLSLALTITDYILFSLDRPILLSAFVASTFYFANAALKYGLYLFSLLADETINRAALIEGAHPKTYLAWEKANAVKSTNKP